MDYKGKKLAADDPAVPGLSRKDIFLLIKKKLNDGAAAAYEEIEKAMSEKLQRPFTLSSVNVKRLIRNLLMKFKDKWKSVSRHEDTFLEKFSDWLSIFVPLEETPEASKKSNNMGRPSLEFYEASERTKRRKTEQMRARTSTEELSYATQMNLRASGKLDAAKVIKDVTLGSPSKAKQYRESIGSISETPFSSNASETPFSSIILEANLSKSQYQKICNASKENCSKLFPSYKKVHQAKLKYYPTKADISITECNAEVKLQALLDHTSERILLTQADVINSMS